MYEIPAGSGTRNPIQFPGQPESLPDPSSSVPDSSKGQRSVAGTESRTNDAADVVVPRRYAECIGGQLRWERVLGNACCAWMLLRAVGRGSWARGCSGWWGFARGEPRGGGACRQCDQLSWDGIVEVQCPSIVHGAALKRLPPRREIFANSVVQAICPSAPDFASGLPPTNK